MKKAYILAVGLLGCVHAADKFSSESEKKARFMKKKDPKKKDPFYEKTSPAQLRKYMSVRSVSDTMLLAKGSLSDLSKKK